MVAPGYGYGIVATAALGYVGPQSQKSLFTCHYCTYIFCPAINSAL